MFYLLSEYMILQFLDNLSSSIDMSVYEYT